MYVVGVYRSEARMFGQEEPDLEVPRAINGEPLERGTYSIDGTNPESECRVTVYENGIQTGIRLVKRCTPIEELLKKARVDPQ
jgi:hypothetical protein